MTDFAGESDDVRQDPIQIGEHLLGRDAEDPKALGSEPIVALIVPCRLIASIMCFAVDFHDQLGDVAVEVEDVMSVGMLAAEFQT